MILVLSLWDGHGGELGDAGLVLAHRVDALEQGGGHRGQGALGSGVARNGDVRRRDHSGGGHGVTPRLASDLR